MTVRGVPSDATPGFVVTTAKIVHDAIARCALAGETSARPAIPERLGSIQLLPHQIDAAVRLQRPIADAGGALLADEVGLGKTYVALALAHDARRLVVVAPAALLAMWRSALERVQRTATLVSFERLSRAGGRASIVAGADPDLVVVDEAHHVRTPTTRRYAALATLCARSRMLLLSATPLHNSRRDLAAQLALFLGAAAWTMSDEELTRYVVRRTRDDVRDDAPPAVASPVWVELPSTDDCLEALLALPPPIPPSDGGDGGALLVYALVRRWASSRAALRATLQRRLARAAALTAVLETGRYPSTAEVAAWTYADASVQLAFPELIAHAVNPTHATGRSPDIPALLGSVRAHEGSVRELLRTLDATPDPDVDRAAAIRAIRSRHPGERVIAFAESAETVEALFRHLRRDAGVAMLGARKAAVSGGAISRGEALARFAPAAQGARAPHASQRIDLLLATDLLSEGVNLQDASVVVHLDLPWNPARLEQRVGRASRLGSPHERVTVYAIRPPAAAERLLAVEQRLRAKLATAGRALGAVGTILPGLSVGEASARGAAAEWTRVHAMLSRWRSTEHGRSRRPKPRSSEVTSCPQVAAVRSPARGFIAALMRSGRPILIASLDGTEPSTAGRDVADTMALASGADDALDRGALMAATEAIDRWLSHRAAAELSGTDVGDIARARRRVLTRIRNVSARAPRHLRSAISQLAAQARHVAVMPLAEGAERILAELADAPLADQSWLRAINAFGDLHTRRRDTAAASAIEQTRLVGLLLLQAEDAPDD